MKINRILILTSNYGDGHIKTANSLMRQIKEIDSSIDVKIVNLFGEAHPVLNKFIRYTYLKSYSIVPKVYDFVYYFTRHPQRNLYINKVNSLLGRKKLKGYLNTYKPDLVINTFSILAMPLFYKRGITKVPCYTIVTDYGVHSQWIHDGTCKYFVAHEKVKHEMINYGVDENKIKVSGIPVYLECNEDVDKPNVLNKYDIQNNEMPLITILGGANGIMRNVESVCSKLYSIEPKAQFVVVCGRNEKLKERLVKFTEKFSDRIKILGFVDNLHELMKASDIVVTKPGGLTVTEVLNLHVPFILYGSPAGQEKENTKFLLEKECSYHARNINELVERLKFLMNQSSKLEKMRDNIKLISKPSSCKEIIEYIISDFEEKAEE